MNALKNAINAQFKVRKTREKISAPLETNLNVQTVKDVAQAKRQINSIMERRKSTVLQDENRQRNNTIRNL